MINRAQDLFLLLFRFYWGYEFFESGLGKFKNIDRVIGFFTDLNIPLSKLAAYCVASAEFLGGILLFFGLLTRPAATILTLTMLGAYWFADWDSVLALWSEPSKFMDAAPFGFLFAAILLLCFGAGMASIDGLIRRLRRR